MFPPSFDIGIYKTHRDIAKLKDDDLETHYLNHGFQELIEQSKTTNEVLWKKI